MPNGLISTASIAPKSRNRLLDGLTVGDFADGDLMLREYTLIRHSVLHTPNDAIEYVYFPLSGMISILTVTLSGDQIETAVVGREGVVGGSIGLFGPKSFGQATVQMPGIAMRAPAKNVLALYKKSDAFRLALNEFQSVLFAQAQQSAACHARHSVKARLCRWIAQAQDVSETDNIPLTQEFLAQMLGAQRSYVNTCVTGMQKERAIQSSRGSIRILDRSAIRNSACECYALVRSLTAPSC